MCLRGRRAANAATASRPARRFTPREGTGSPLLALPIPMPHLRSSPRWNGHLFEVSHGGHDRVVAARSATPRRSSIVLHPVSWCTTRARGSHSTHWTVNSKQPSTDSKDGGSGDSSSSSAGLVAATPGSSSGDRVSGGGESKKARRGVAGHPATWGIGSAEIDAVASPAPMTYSRGGLRSGSPGWVGVRDGAVDAAAQKRGPDGSAAERAVGLVTVRRNGGQPAARHSSGEATDTTEPATAKREGHQVPRRYAGLPAEQHVADRAPGEMCSRSRTATVERQPHSRAFKVLPSGATSRPATSPKRVAI